MGIKKRIQIEVAVALGRAIRPIYAQRPRGIAVFLPQANPSDLRNGDKLLSRGSVAKVVTDTAEYVFSDFDNHSWARIENDEKVKIAGARSHDGLAIGEHIAFHQGCATKFSPDDSPTSVTTGAVQHLFIDNVPIF